MNYKHWFQFNIKGRPFIHGTPTKLFEKACTLAQFLLQMEKVKKLLKNGLTNFKKGEITIKGTKGLVDNQFFMYLVYFENVSHISFK